MYKCGLIAVALLTGCAAPNEIDSNYANRDRSAAADIDAQVGNLRCAADIASPVGATTAFSPEVIVSEKTVTLDNYRELSEQESRMILIADELLFDFARSSGVHDVLAIVDDGAVDLTTLLVEEGTFHWVRLRFHGRELGVFFGEPGTVATVVARVHDGQVLGCELDDPWAPDSDAKANI